MLQLTNFNKIYIQSKLELIVGKQQFQKNAKIAIFKPLCPSLIEI